MIETAVARLEAELKVLRKEREAAVQDGRAAQATIERVRLFVARADGAIAAYEKMLAEARAALAPGANRLAALNGAYTPDAG